MTSIISLLELILGNYRQIQITRFKLFYNRSKFNQTISVVSFYTLEFCEYWATLLLSTIIISTEIYCCEGWSWHVQRIIFSWISSHLYNENCWHKCSSTDKAMGFWKRNYFPKKTLEKEKDSAVHFQDIKYFNTIDLDSGYWQVLNNLAKGDHEIYTQHKFQELWYWCCPVNQLTLTNFYYSITS